MSLLRTGSSEKYSANWAKAFGAKKSSATTATKKVSAPKAKASAVAKPAVAKKKIKRR